MRLCFARHQEEAAIGAALVAGVAVGTFVDLSDAGKVVEYPHFLDRVRVDSENEGSHTD